MKRILLAALAAWSGWAAAAITPADLVRHRLDLMLNEVSDWVARQ